MTTHEIELTAPLAEAISRTAKIFSDFRPNTPSAVFLHLEMGAITGTEKSMNPYHSGGGQHSGKLGQTEYLTWDYALVRSARLLIQEGTRSTTISLSNDEYRGLKPSAFIDIERIIKYLSSNREPF